MKRGTYPLGFVSSANILTDQQLSKRFGFTVGTIRTWKSKLGLPLKPQQEVLHAKIDALLKEKIPIPDIKKKTGASESAIKVRKRLLFGVKRKALYATKEEGRPAPPTQSSPSPIIATREKRFMDACEAKAKDRGMTLGEFRDKWLSTPTGQSWARDMGF